LATSVCKDCFSRYRGITGVEKYLNDKIEKTQRDYEAYIRKSEEIYDRYVDERIESKNDKVGYRYVSSKVKKIVYERDRGRCAECGRKENLEFDHIIPVSEGGSSTENNIQILCLACNRKKSNRIE